MNIVILMKRTFDTEEKIEIQDGQISTEHANYVINPYDEYAIEEGLSLKEQFGGEIIVLSVGPAETEKEIRTALAMGADRSILIDDSELSGDEHTTALLLAEKLRDIEFDIVLAGNVSIDNGAGQVAPRVAEMLNIPQVTTIVNLTIEGNKASVERDVEGDVEMIETSLPALFTAQQGLNEPRYPSLPGIMKAKKKPLEIVQAEDLSVDLTGNSAKTETMEISLPSQKKEGKIMEGELEEQVKELVQCLRDEEKALS